MNKKIIKLNFSWNGGMDVDYVALLISEEITNTRLKLELDKANEELQSMEHGGYNDIGCNYQSLMNYLCEKNKWSWEKFSVDLDWFEV